MIKWIYSLVIFIILSGCNFLDEYSQDLVTPKTVKDLDEILLGNGYLQRKEVKELRYGGLAWWLHLLDDDINTVREQQAVRGSMEMDQSYFGYTTWQMEVGRSHEGSGVRSDNAEWSELYNRINAMNIILNEIDDLPQESDADKLIAMRIKGESLFLRAQYYLLLVNIYAPMYNPGKAAETLGVPLKLTHYVEHDKDKETQFVRSSVATVYEQIVTDLKQSIEYLVKSPQTKAHRASQNAAMLLLSRVYLYMQDWTNAEIMAKHSVDANPVLLDYNTLANEVPVINADNAEIIFSQGALNLQNVFTGRGGDFCVSNDLYDSYSDDDYRKDIFFSKALSDSIAMNRKYKTGLHVSPISDLYTFRSSESYLNLMEAKAMLNKEGEAHELLRKFQGFRMKIVPEDTYTLEQLVKEIREERRKELCLEGHRWFDLRRYAQCEKHPFKKEIIRMYSTYNWNDKNKFESTEIYILNKDDKSYTFSIPKSVMDFDIDMVDNPREMRKPIDIITETENETENE